MKYYKIPRLIGLIWICVYTNVQAQGNQNYEAYHKEIVEAEKLISSEKYEDALLLYVALFNEYDFIFLKDCQIATQLAFYLKDEQKGIQYLKKGILAGWEIKSIKKNKFLSKTFDDQQWKTIKKDYNELRAQYKTNLNEHLRKKVKKMFSKDQWRAFRALFTFNSKAQDRYAEKKFAPHSEQQIDDLKKILEAHGYPGQKLIGNDFWMSTILSHHNSISHEYVKKDTLYPKLKPLLKKAIKDGQISPFEYALIDEWYLSVKNNHSESNYGFINPPALSELTKINHLREAIYLRTIEVRNKLIDVQQKTGMHFYLPGAPWVQGKIMVQN